MDDILRILEQDARTPPERIAEMTGRSIDDVREAIVKAERDGIILSYRSQVNWDALGRGDVHAIIEVRVAPQREVGFDSVAARIARFPEVRSMHLVSGDYDLAVQVTGESIYAISNFVASKLAVLDAVQGTVTHFVLKRYKEDGSLFETEDDSPRRLPVSM
jgi:DNA-binding Lrp family transcriptional regulator